MDFTLHQLRIFLKVVEKRSISRAADELHLTQPAVSIQIKNLQKQLDLQLVEVIGRQLYVTEFGKEIATTSRQILSLVEDISNKTLSYKGLLVGQLKIAVVSTGKYVMPYFLKDFSALHPGVELKMDVTNRSLVVANLEKNEVDFALVSVLPEHLNTDQIELVQNKLYMVRKSKTEEASNIEAEPLEDIQLIYREKGSATRQAMERFISGHDISPRRSIELTSNEAVKQAVLAGLGYSVMPLIGIKNELLNNELEIIPIKGLPITTHWNLVWLNEKKLSPVAMAYLAFLQASKDDVIKENFSWYEKYSSF